MYRDRRPARLATVGQFAVSPPGIDPESIGE